MTELAEFFTALPAAFIAASTLLGLVVGSFSSNITRKRVSLH